MEGGWGMADLLVTSLDPGLVRALSQGNKAESGEQDIHCAPLASVYAHKHTFKYAFALPSCESCDSSRENGQRGTERIKEKFQPCQNH